MANESPGYLVVIQKVTSLSGESIQVSFNLPRDATEADFEAELTKVTNALDSRLIKQNEKVLAISEATRKALSLETMEPRE